MLKIQAAFETEATANGDLISEKSFIAYAEKVLGMDYEESFLAYQRYRAMTQQIVVCDSCAISIEYDDSPEDTAIKDALKWWCEAIGCMAITQNGHLWIYFDHSKTKVTKYI